MSDDARAPLAPSSAPAPTCPVHGAPIVASGADNFYRTASCSSDCRAPLLDRVPTPALRAAPTGAAAPTELPDLGDFAPIYHWIISDPRTLPREVCEAVERLHIQFRTRDSAASPAARAPARAGTTERPFPIQGPTTHRTIPWWLAEEAYAVYSSRYGTDQSLERLAQRGGFGADELDMLIPGWRDKLDRVKRLESENATLRAEVSRVQDDNDRARASHEAWEIEHHRICAAIERERDNAKAEVSRLSASGDAASLELVRVHGEWRRVDEFDPPGRPT